MRLGYRLLILAALFSLGSSPARAQWLYVSADPVDCVVDQTASVAGGSYTVYLYAPDHGAATAVYFRLEVDDLGNEDEVMVTPASDVGVGGDIRTGMAASFSSPGTGHVPLLTISFVDHAPTAESFPSGMVFIGVRDAVLSLPGGATLPMEDMDAIRIHCSSGGGLDFRPPVSPNAVIGKTTMVTFTGMSTGGYYGPGATNLIATDTAGWVQSMSSSAIWNYGCGQCPWFWEPLVLTVTLPGDVTPGTTTLVTLSEDGSTLTQFSLTAISPNPTESKSWGAIKALYR